MTSGSIGSHRAFMGVCITLCLCLSLTLYMGWKYYFLTLSNRISLLEMDQEAGRRVQDLENLGISVIAPQADSAAPALPPKVIAAGGEIHQAVPSASPPPPHDPAPPPAIGAPDSLFPAASMIKELPLQESSEEVVQALALLDLYWKTKPWQERVPLVAHSEHVATLMQDYYVTQGGTDPVPGSLISKARYQIDSSEILYFSYSSTRPTGSLEVAMLRSPQGKFLIDWESLTGYGEMSFNDFRARRPTKPVLMRTYVRLFEYYNFEFADAKKYLCVKLISENGENSIYAYCERGTKLARWIDTDLATTGPSGFKGYTMLLSFPPAAQSNQCVNLDQVLAQRWLRLP